MTHLVKQNSCRLILFSYSTTMPWWPPQVLIVGLCTLCFFVWPLEVCGGRQPSLPASPELLAPTPTHVFHTDPVPHSAAVPGPYTYSQNVQAVSPSLVLSSRVPKPAPSPLNPPPSPSVSSPVLFPTSAPTGFQDGPGLAPPPSNSTAPSPSPSGCCTVNMIARPGSKALDCECVYPIKIVFEMENASSAFTNLTSQFQHELASQLGLIDIQVQIQAFQFGNNFSLNMVVNIGPLVGLAFSPEKIESTNKTLSSRSVKFSSILFSNYTVVSVTAFLPSFPPTGSFVPMISPTSSPPSLDGNPAANAKLPSSGFRWRPWKTGVVAGAGTLFLILVCITWRIFRRKTNVKDPESSNKVSAVPNPPGTSSTRMVTTRVKSFPRPSNTRVFSYEELQEATKNFSLECFIGAGGFGKVYKGVLKDGTEVAIKKLTSGGNQGDKEFMVEVEMLSRLHHRHLVKLLGFYCSLEPLQQLLCYELIPNGSLESWLHGPLSLSRDPLDWNIRMKIALGAARGLAYLHEDSQPCVIHRDFKASNILLENNFSPKVADFGLARSAPDGQQDYVSTRVMGTFGYVAPEYAMTGHLLVKSDVYSFGVVMLELLSGRKPVDYSRPPGEENIVAWARPLIEKRNKLHELADPRMGGNYPPEDFARVAIIAGTCVAPEWSDRPTMGEVVQQLKAITGSHVYTFSRDADRSMSSEGEREGLVETPTSGAASNKTLATARHAHRSTVTTFGSDGSSSMFSSGPFSGLIGIENDPLTRTSIISEDLQEGR
ncbi:receptor-like serine/threonine-protein kinase ALE2 isoform X2 [Physcomitrium patens]|uniref:receptor-like serine/threonine-protein kinase ALE2 isoform X2 n=1 Tax=Physcomitrium patens TaxID=3218 RepID=UPI000D15E051|nr:proline-rich receptor-like protein kinase PERK15 isoform X2 [Physcomitrium patens]|eukprot:XP_024377051.1 proline-rich receptor-like protein kinase PERK15 isoform X2 [Physcomitrella patens]